STLKPWRSPLATSRQCRESSPMTPEKANKIATRLVQWLKTGEVPVGLFTNDVFCDHTVPQWRLQAQGVAGTAALRKEGHPALGEVPRWRGDPTPTGFVIEFEETWSDVGQEWYCREMARADVRGESIAALSVYCTGDWDAV